MKKYCAARESNPGRKNGNLACYHYTSGALVNELQLEKNNFIMWKHPFCGHKNVERFTILRVILAQGPC